jgi:ABC-type uncharacterized transport system substrate-binding protein
MPTIEFARPAGRRAGLFAVILLGLAGWSDAAWSARCLYISSYHQGYAWSDGVERGLRQTLEGRCELRQFDMDTKRNKSEADKQAAAAAARQLIESWQPDVVMVSDDNAAKYLIVPHYKDAELPFVFCGINWTVAEYGFPYKNVTGMIEVAPVAAMIEEAKALTHAPTRTLYIGADTVTERKNAERIRRAVEASGLSMTEALVPTFKDWLAAYQAGQDYDFIIMGSNAGINDWDDATAAAAVLPITRRVSVTSHEWMMPVTMLGMTKVPEEQGEWAAKVALQILEGTAPDSIPIIANRKWDLYLNHRLLQAAGIELPEKLLQKGKQFQVD